MAIILRCLQKILTSVMKKQSQQSQAVNQARGRPPKLFICGDRGRKSVSFVGRQVADNEPEGFQNRCAHADSRV